MPSIIALPALADNYIWVIHGITPAHIIVVDPGDANPVLDYIKQNNLSLKGILLTHHHKDHSGGVRALLNHSPNIPVYSSLIDKVAGVTHCVQEGDLIHFESLDTPIKILNIPGHTLGHLAFMYNNALFSGDTLFSTGCGKIFEGTPEQMYSSLEKLKKLSIDTLIYCGHEYTLKNIAFAQVVEPDNIALEMRKKEVEALRKQGRPSLPVKLKTELETNPFLRCTLPHIIKNVEKHSNAPLNNPIDVFAAMRYWKNNFT